MTDSKDSVKLASAISANTIRARRKISSPTLSSLSMNWPTCLVVVVEPVKTGVQVSVKLPRRNLASLRKKLERLEFTSLHPLSDRVLTWLQEALRQTSLPDFLFVYPVVRTVERSSVRKERSISSAKETCSSSIQVERDSNDS